VTKRTNYKEQMTRQKDGGQARLCYGHELVNFGGQARLCYGHELVNFGGQARLCYGYELVNFGGQADNTD